MVLYITNKTLSSNTFGFIYMYFIVSQGIWPNRLNADFGLERPGLYSQPSARQWCDYRQVIPSLPPPIARAVGFALFAEAREHPGLHG